MPTADELSAFDTLLGGLGSCLGIPGLKANGEGYCHLMFDGSRRLDLCVAPQQHRVLLGCRVSGVITAAAMRLLLQANAWGGGAAGGWFALDEADRLWLHQATPLDGGAVEMLIEQIEGLLNTAEMWEGKLAEAVSFATDQMANFGQYGRV